MFLIKKTLAYPAVYLPGGGKYSKEKSPGKRDRGVVEGTNTVSALLSTLPPPLINVCLMNLSCVYTVHFHPHHPIPPSLFLSFIFSQYFYMVDKSTPSCVASRANRSRSPYACTYRHTGTLSHVHALARQWNWHRLSSVESNSTPER